MKEAPYAWVVVWATFVSLGVIFGVAYSFAAFFDSFAAEFSAKRADVALVFGLTGLIYFAFGAVGGMLSDRFGARLICSLGMLCIAAGLLLTSFAQSLNAVYLFYSVGIGVGIALAYTPSIGNVQPWFTARRGLASGIASSGIGLGTLLVPLLATLLIASMDWRMALRMMSAAVIMVGLGSTLLLKRAQLGPRNSSTPLPGLTLAQALKDKRFWWFYLFTFTAAPTMFIPFATCQLQRVTLASAKRMRWAWSA